MARARVKADGVQGGSIRAQCDNGTMEKGQWNNGLWCGALVLASFAARPASPHLLFSCRPLIAHSPRPVALFLKTATSATLTESWAISSAARGTRVQDAHVPVSKSSGVHAVTVESLNATRM